MATRFIVSADDFGLSARVNAGIVDAHRNGIVTSTTIMAVGAAFEDAARLAGENPDLDIGVHLTLVGERALLPPGKIPSLADEAGRLPVDVFAFARDYVRGRIRLTDIRAELNAQLERVRSAGLRVTHIDSHQHVHMLGGILETTAELCVAHRVPYLRRAAEHLGRQLLCGRPLPQRLLQLAAVRTVALRSWPDSVRCTDRFYGFYSGGRLTEAHLAAVIRSMRPGVVAELMCHPGLHDPGYAAWGYDWETELTALKSPRVRQLLDERRVSLTRFCDLPH
jgi:predicted glycoside hydrolase/deacetylase ChbG (UPF0249 family)